MQPECDGCGAHFTLQHALECKKGGLIHVRHNEVKAELTELCSLALSPSSVRDEPLINPVPLNTDKKSQESNNNQPTDSQETVSNDGDRGDILVRGLHQNGKDCIIDVRVTDLDSKSYLSRAPAKVLKTQEKEKRSKYLEPCLQQRRSFVPFVVSTDGMLGYEANNLLKCLARKLAGRWKRPYSVVCSLVRTRVAIAIARATHLCIRGSRVPASQTSRRILWEDGAGVSLFETDY